MTTRRPAVQALMACLALVTMGCPVDRAQAATSYLIPVGAEIPLATDQDLSSKMNVKGDMVALVTTADVVVSGKVVIPKGTPATGQVAEARAKGALGMSGKLAIRPLYIRMGDTYIRLSGVSADKGSVTAGAVVGMIVLTPGFTGRSAYIPKGTKLSAFVEHAVTMTLP